MDRELRDLYDYNLNNTGKTYRKGDSIPDGYYPMVVFACISNNKGEFLLQKRSLNKGGNWGVTGGHPKSGETCIEGMITEIKEELGVSVTADQLTEVERGCDGTDCFVMYYTVINKDINEFIIQEEELLEVRWFSLKELPELASSNQLSKNQLECFLRLIKFLAEKNPLQTKVRNFNNNKPCHTKPMPVYARILDINSEMGELGKEYLKHSRYGTEQFTLTEEFLMEYGDVLYSLLSLAEELNIDSDNCLNMAIAKYQARIEKNGSMGSEKSKNGANI